MEYIINVENLWNREETSIITAFAKRFNGVSVRTKKEYDSFFGYWWYSVTVICPSSQMARQVRRAINRVYPYLSAY